jgi:hypothetical protein
VVDAYEARMSEGKVRSRRLNLAEFRRLIAIERKIAKSHGFGIKIQYRPFSWGKVRDYGTHANVSGLFDEKAKIVKVTNTGRPSRTWVMAVLYHEMRHLEHYIKGMFLDYYRLTPDAIQSILDDDIVPEGFKAPCIRTALLAERDCDRDSSRKLRALGLRYTFKPYPARNTLSFAVITSMEFILARKIKIEPQAEDTISLRAEMHSVAEKIEAQLQKLRHYKGSNMSSYAEIRAVMNHLRCIIDNNEENKNGKG